MAEETVYPLIHLHGYTDYVPGCEDEQAHCSLVKEKSQPTVGEIIAHMLGWKAVPDRSG